MRIWLARHGEAVGMDAVSTDHDRWLSERGRDQMLQVGRWLKIRETPPDLILHSPLVRASETAELIRQGIDPDLPIAMEPLLSPGMRCESLLAKIAARTEMSVLCIGHQPDIGRCLGEMLGGGRFGISPGTIAGIEFPEIIAAGGGRLQWMIDPNWFG